MNSLVPWGIAVFGLASLAQGCFVEVDNDRGGSNRLTVEWTIAGSTDPDECVLSDVDQAYVRIESSQDGLIDETEVDCEDFGVEFDLPDGRYWATVVLTDSAGRDRTTPADTDTIDLRGRDDYVVLNFSDRSFF